MLTAGLTRPAPAPDCDEAESSMRTVARMVTMLRRRSWKSRYGLALAAVLAATGISVIVRPMTHATDSPLFVAAVMLSAWLGGMGPSLLATALAVGALDSVMAPKSVPFILNEEVIARLSLFVFVALFISALDAARRRADSERATALEAERKARAEAEAANRAKDEFVTMVAHELRTPLTAILGWSAALGSGRMAGLSTPRAIEAIERSARLQARVIDDLVDLSQVARGKVSFHVAPVDLRIIIEASVEAIADTAAAREIKLALDVAPRCAAVAGDAARLQQVVLNLLGNAIKHSRSGATVFLSLAAKGGQARIEVRDEGYGIAPDLLPHVFEPYRQGEGEIARSGLGLGLAIVRQLVELHGGRVEASSPGVGLGAGFTVLLPTIASSPLE